jgi:tRNA A37 methylthiotransferase MiaB
VKGARDRGKPVILIGCVPSADANLAKSLVGVSMLGVSQLDRVVEVVEQALQGHHATWKISAGFQQVVFFEQIGYHWFLFMIYQYIIYIHIYIYIYHHVSI